MFQELRKDVQVLTDMREELLVAGTHIMESRFTVRGFREPVFGASAPAGLQHLTLPAVFGERLLFVWSES